MENLPEDWPEMYSRMGIDPTCPHQMQWIDEREEYRCINNCGYSESEPPETKI